MLLPISTIQIYFWHTARNSNSMILFSTFIAYRYPFAFFLFLSISSINVEIKIDRARQTEIKCPDWFLPTRVQTKLLILITSNKKKKTVGWKLFVRKMPWRLMLLNRNLNSPRCTLWRRRDKWVINVNNECGIHIVGNAIWENAAKKEKDARKTRRIKFAEMIVRFMCVCEHVISTVVSEICRYTIPQISIAQIKHRS